MLKDVGGEVGRDGEVAYNVNPSETRPFGP